MSRASSTRRSFLASSVAAAALPLIPGKRSNGRFQASAPTGNPGAIPLFAAVVEDPSGQRGSDILGHYPSRHHAAKRFEIESRMNPEYRRTINQVGCRTTGAVFLVIETYWDEYDKELDLLYSMRQRESDYAAEKLRNMAATTGFDETRILADLEDYAGRPPRHALDLPDVVVITDTDQTWGEASCTDRETALEQAAGFNARQLAEDAQNPEEWAYVLEVSEPVPEVASSEFTFSGRIGVERRFLTYAVQVVEPTEAEIARYGRPVGLA